MKPLTAAILVAIWMVSCIGAFVALGVTVLNNPAWWGFGGLFTICLIVFPIITYNFTEG